MINYDNKEERKIFSEALAKYFPLDSLTVIKQEGAKSSCNGPLIPVKEYFDTLNCDYGTITLFLDGKFGWWLCVDIDPLFQKVKFKRICNSYSHSTNNIEYCSFWFEWRDPIDMLEKLFIRHRYEYRLAKYLFKLAKAAYIRTRKKDHDKKIRALKEELR